MVIQPSDWESEKAALMQGDAVAAWMKGEMKKAEESG